MAEAGPGRHGNAKQIMQRQAGRGGQVERQRQGWQSGRSRAGAGEAGKQTFSGAGMQGQAMAGKQEGRGRKSRKGSGRQAEAGEASADRKGRE
jgi:hypothetical protein